MTDNKKEAGVFKLIKAWLKDPETPKKVYTRGDVADKAMTEVTLALGTSACVYVPTQGQMQGAWGLSQNNTGNGYGPAVGQQQVYTGGGYELDAAATMNNVANILGVGVGLAQTGMNMWAQGSAIVNQNNLVDAQIDCWKIGAKSGAAIDYAIANKINSEANINNAHAKNIKKHANNYNDRMNGAYGPGGGGRGVHGR